MDAAISDGLYCPPSATSGTLVQPAVIVSAEDTAPQEIPPARGAATDTGIPPARIVKAEDTGP